jgi:hypothetical protein
LLIFLDCSSRPSTSSLNTKSWKIFLLHIFRNSTSLVYHLNQHHFPLLLKHCKIPCLPCAHHTMIACHPTPIFLQDQNFLQHKTSSHHPYLSLNNLIQSCLQMYHHILAHNSTVCTGIQKPTCFCLVKIDNKQKFTRDIKSDLIFLHIYLISNKTKDFKAR